ncbi:sugar ABC transporter substrate-binding protein [Paraburkholderia tuberum]|uniref:Monosaccharide ABC transporter substrate-binding protein, CUT2 family n=1 Tax=Paraburkholderia tuberum TaxID=157910 RepID=A0A1H1KI24_9BURK|nr:sugar ABC transporter substrate-binding protein [Paraburkholderia tuberum]SDR61425.1 monosaccharide ABC transporter substrate-binding protein, CUT2 family [Paraburkholderia tuberum]
MKHLRSISRRTILKRSVAIAAATLIVGGLSAPAGAIAAVPTAKGKSVQYVTFGLQFEYQVAMVDGIKKRAKDSGLNLETVDGKGDPNLQMTQALDAVSRKPDALLVDPVDAKLITAGVKKANANNVPVFMMENAPPEGKYDALVEFDNQAGGAMGADTVAKLVGDKGTVLELRGSVDSAQAQARHQGFIDRMKSKYPNIKVKSLNTEWNADNAYKMVLDALTQDPDIKGIFSHNDEMVRGVISALRQTNRLVPAGKPGHLFIVGLDGTPLALNRIRAGTQDASVGQNPVAMGSDIVDAIVAGFQGKPYPKSMHIEPVLITKANVDDPTLWGNFERKK